jgi:putative transposase
VKPAAKRKVVQRLQEQHRFSQRRATQLVGCNRMTARYLSRREEESQLTERLKDLACTNPALGYRMLYGLLRLEGWPVNHKKVYHLYREANLQLRRRGKKRLKSEGRGMPQAATSTNEEWALDFVHDSLSDGRSFRTLNMIDAFTRECLAMETDTSLGSERVVRVLEQQVERRGVPQRLRIDNGPEFRAKPLDVWAKKNGVTLFFIEPGKPTQNGQIESFNGRFRQECLNQEWFTTLNEARQIIEEWRISYNTKRPHSSLGYMPPEVWAKQHSNHLQSLYL